MRGTVRILAVFLLFGSGIWTPARSDSKTVGDSEEAMSVKSALLTSRAQANRSPRPRRPKGQEPKQEDKGQRPKKPRPKEPEARPQPPIWDDRPIYPRPVPGPIPGPPGNGYPIIVEYVPIMHGYDKPDQRTLAASAADVTGPLSATKNRIRVTMKTR